jgi:hypothetical protein
MRKALTGRNARLDIKVDTTWFPALCANECAYYFDHEEILITSRNSGKFTERETGLLNWGFSVTGLSKVDDTDGQKGFFYLCQASVRGTKQMMRIVYTDNDGNSQTISGYVLIKQGTFTSTIPAFSVASMNFPGTGEPDLGAVSGGTPLTEHKLYLSTTAGAFEVAHADLANASQIMLVLREDGGYTEISGGSPAGRQFKYTNLVTSGKLTFDNTLPFNPGEIVYVRFYS